MDDSESTVTSADTKLMPVYSDGTPIRWDENYATIPAVLYETQRFFKRAGLFRVSALQSEALRTAYTPTLQTRCVEGLYGRY